ncbi:MAG: D-arabinono-1,4-lactone oxidase [Planctomycetota bacterium]
MTRATFRNWAGQYACTPQRVHRPRSADEVAAVLADARARGRRVRVIGAAHSPSDIAMSDDELIALDLPPVCERVDDTRVRVSGDMPLRDLHPRLAALGLAMPNLGSISDQTVAGAIATATHGTGLRHGVLGTIVESAQVVAPTGVIAATGDMLHAARCSLGCLGVHTSLVLNVVPAFDLDIHERPARLDDVLDRLDESLAADHYRFWWVPHTDTALEWTATRVPPDAALRRAPRASLAWWWRERFNGFHRFQCKLWLAALGLASLPRVNQWFARTMFNAERRVRVPSIAGFNFDCLFRQHVDEWAIPREHCADALRRLRAAVDAEGLHAHLPVEVRFAAADDIWLSPCHGRESCYIGVIAYRPYGREPGDRAHRRWFDAFERIMLDLDGRPHWAKRFGPTAADLALRYPRWHDFQRVRAQLDPDGTLANSYTDRVLGPVASPSRDRKSLSGNCDSGASRGRKSPESGS